MERCLKFVLIAFWFSFLPVSGLTLEEMETRFSTAVSESESAISEQLSVLKKKYLEALFRYESEVKRSGDLDGLNIVRNEIERVSSLEGFIPSLPTGLERVDFLSRVMGREVNNVYETEASKLSSLIDSVTAYSENQIIELTRQGDLESALALREWTEALREQPKVDAILRRGSRVSGSTSSNKSLPKLLRGSPTSIARKKQDKFDIRPVAYEKGCEPTGKEKRVQEHRTSAVASGMTTFQAKLGLLEEKENLASYRGWGYRSDHDSFLYVARLEIGLLPNQSLGRTLVVFDLFKRGSGSQRSVIRTEGLLLPEMSSGDRWVIDSGTYSYEVREADSSWGYDSKSTTGDEFYGYTVSIFDEAGDLIFQRCTERALSEIARTELPSSFDPPQSPPE